MASNKSQKAEIQLVSCMTKSFNMIQNSQDQERSEIAFKKAVDLVSAALELVIDPVSAEIEEASVFYPFVEKLTHLIAYCTDEEVRKLSIDLLQKFLRNFVPVCGNKLMSWIFKTTTHDSLYGFFVMELKERVRLALDEKNAEMVAQFCGANLNVFLNQICQINAANLISYPEPELMGQSDRIISSLNFLRFLYIRDYQFNESGFLGAMEKIIPDYIEPLTIAIDITISRIQSQLQIVKGGTSLTAPRPGEEDDSDEEVLIIDGVETRRRDISLSDQISSLQAAVLTLEIMADVVSHVNEFINVPETSSPVLVPDQKIEKEGEGDEVSK